MPTRVRARLNDRIRPPLDPDTFDGEVPSEATPIISRSMHCEHRAVDDAHHGVRDSLTRFHVPNSRTRVGRQNVRIVTDFGTRA